MICVAKVVSCGYLHAAIIGSVSIFTAASAGAIRILPTDFSLIEATALSVLVFLVLCYRGMAKKLQNLTLSLFPEDDEPDTADEQQKAVMRGIAELEDYTSLRPDQMFTIRLPYPIYLEFKREVQRWQLEAESHQAGLKKRYTMTAFVTAAVQKVILPGLKKRSPISPQEACRNNLPRAS